MSNTQSYVRTAIAFLIGVFAIEQELWFLLLFSMILLYTAYQRFCLMFRLLGINKRLRVENYYHALLPEHSPFPSYIFDDNKDLLFANEVAKKELPHIRTIDDLNILSKKTKLSELPNTQMFFEYKDRTYQLYMEGIDSEEVLLVYLIDITEVLSLKVRNNTLSSEVDHVNSENELKDRLLAQQSKFATTGELIENITHQWRQPLSALNAILTGVKVLENFKNLKTETLIDYMDRGTALVAIMNDTVSDFKNFFKEDKKKEIFFLHDCLKNVKLILGGTLIQHHIELLDDMDPSLTVLGHKNEFTQVLLNIVNNAKDAINTNESVTKCISIDVVVDKENIHLRISDTAGGIAKEHITKVFDAHFTTKDEEGTGIGLHMSKLIIEKDMQGELSVCNVKDGAQFLITLPLVKA